MILDLQIYSNRFITSSWDKTVKCWDMVTGKLLVRFDFNFLLLFKSINVKFYFKVAKWTRILDYIVRILVRSTRRFRLQRVWHRLLGEDLGYEDGQTGRQNCRLAYEHDNKLPVFALKRTHRHYVDGQEHQILRSSCQKYHNYTQVNS